MVMSGETIVAIVVDGLISVKNEAYKSDFIIDSLRKFKLNDELAP